MVKHVVIVQDMVDVRDYSVAAQLTHHAIGTQCDL